MKQKFYRKCSNCGTQISYTSERCYKTAIKKNTLCKVCVGLLQPKGSQNKKAIDEKTETIICREYTEGSTVKNLANKYEVSTSTIRRCLHTNKIVLRKNTDEFRKFESKEQREKFYKESEYYKKYREQNKDLLSQKKKEKGKNGAYKLPNRLKKYNITVDEYINILEKQEYMCPICGQPLDFSERYPDLDHCHVSGKVRGILHNKCNRLLACANDNISTLQNAIDYLEEHNL